MMNNEQTKQTALDRFSEKVGDAIIEQITNGKPLFWQKPFDGYGTALRPFNAATCREYSGRNFFALMNNANANDFDISAFLTFKQALDLGGNVKKGEHGATVLKWVEWVDKNAKKEAEETDDEAKKRGCLKVFTVFNVEQCENIDKTKLNEYLNENRPKKARNWKNSSDCEAFALAQGEKIVESDGHFTSFFSTSPRRVSMPRKKYWKSASEYYSTLFHELAHATANRLEMNFGGYHTKAGRAREEITVELAAFIVCNVLGVAKQKSDENSLAYAQTWLLSLKKDKREAVKAWDNANLIAAEMFKKFEEKTGKKLAA